MGLPQSLILFSDTILRGYTMGEQQSNQFSKTMRVIIINLNKKENKEKKTTPYVPLEEGSFTR